MLRLRQSDYEAIVTHCKRELPNEACGLLAGSRRNGVTTVKKVYMLTNPDASSEHFSMHPGEQFAAQKDARTQGLWIVGNFHSHPNTLPIPSEEDRRLAFDTSILYLILSLQDREHPVLRAFAIDKERHVTEEEIQVYKEAPAICQGLGGE